MVSFKEKTYFYFEKFLFVLAPKFDKANISRDLKPTYAAVTKKPSTSREATSQKTHYTKDDLVKCRGLRESQGITIELLSSKGKAKGPLNSVNSFNDL